MPTTSRPGAHRANRGQVTGVGRHRAERRRPAPRRMVVTVTAGVLAAGATLVVEWPVTGSVADEAARVAVDSDRRLASADEARAAPSVSTGKGGGAAGRSSSARAPGSAGRHPTSPRPDGDRTAVSRSGERDGDASPEEPTWLAGCGGDRDLDDHPNGTLPDDELCALPASGHHLRPSAARAWWRLDEAYREEFGASMCVTDSYRSLEQQQSLAVTKPGLAAQPGTSNHGWGSALDLCGGVESFGTAQHNWLSAQASDWGWENPQWAQADGSKPEAWHWEYVEED